MGILVGKQGSVTWDAGAVRQTVLLVQNWSIDVTQDVTAEITSMQPSDNYRNFIGGFNDWSASVECLLDTTGTSINIATGNPNGLGDVEAFLELWLVYDTNNYKGVYGLAICNGISISDEKDSIVAVTYEFQGTNTANWYTSTVLPSL